MIESGNGSEPLVAGDPVPANCEFIGVHVSELNSYSTRSSLHRSANETLIETCNINGELQQLTARNEDRTTIPNLTGARRTTLSHHDGLPGPSEHGDTVEEEMR